MRTALRSSQSNHGRSTGRGTVSSFSTFRYVIIILFFVSFRYFRYFWSITMPSAFVKPLILWYNSECRLLPWRETKDPYRIWVSEIMLQQTRVEAVCGYYERFLAALPDIESLAACPEAARTSAYCVPRMPESSENFRESESIRPERSLRSRSERRSLPSTAM